MAVNAVFNRGHSLLHLPFVIAAGVTTFLASAARAGMVPFRMVILDNSFTTIPVGTKAQAPIKYPNTSFTNGEKLLGAVMGPGDTRPQAAYSATYYPIPVGRPMDVMIAGVAPVMTDSTTSGTPIVPGDFVRASTTANNDGLAAKGTLSSNAPATGQHILGRALNGVTIANGVVMTLIQMQES